VVKLNSEELELDQLERARTSECQPLSDSVSEPECCGRGGGFQLCFLSEGPPAGPAPASVGPGPGAAAHPHRDGLGQTRVPFMIGRLVRVPESESESVTGWRDVARHWHAAEPESESPGEQWNHAARLTEAESLSPARGKAGFKLAQARPR
jgi:hypothetical protein